MAFHAKTRPPADGKKYLNLQQQQSWMKKTAGNAAKKKRNAHSRIGGSSSSASLDHDEIDAPITAAAMASAICCRCIIFCA